MRNRLTISVFLGFLVVGMGLSALPSMLLGRFSVIPKEKEESLLETRNTLRREIALLQEENRVQEEKVAEYLKILEDDEKTYEKLHMDTVRNGMLLGYEAVKGPGVEITLTDGDSEEGVSFNETVSWLRIIHNDDMLKLLNELKIHGAEFVEINGQRVTETSEIFCSGAFISINGEKLPAPFVLKIIGNREKLDAYIAGDFTQLMNLEHRGIGIQLVKLPIMTMEGSISPLVPQYLKDVNE